MSTLIIVESPAKAKKIGQLLGKNYIVKASVGHIYELSKIEENFEPSYELIKGKSKVLKELKDTMKSVGNVILAGDADREGEAISWSVAHALKLPVETCPRIVFHEITKNALEEAVKNPGVLSMDLVNAQKARAVLDRLVGFEISPILWKQIAPSLSAGRVQTPLLHLIMEREKEIEKFKTESYFDTYSEMYCDSAEMKFVGLLNKKFPVLEDVKKFMSDIYPGAIFTVKDVKKGTKTKKPSAPFTTATLLQDAAGKCRMSSKQIMISAQKLYESGKITYHRTDSTNLSKDILSLIKRYAIANYGENYVKLRNYKTKVKNSQEAHEAIRPTHIDQDSLIDESFEPNDKKLYQLIWKRTMASQLADATYATITVTIGNDRREELFVAYGENCTFDGFLRVYHYEEDDNREEDPDKIPDTPYEILSKLEPGKVCKWNDIYSEEKVKQGPGHYSESQLIKKMQDTGIGRPSTYSSMINKLIDRGYVVKENRDMGKSRVHQIRMTSNGKQKETSKEIVLKKEFSKLFPTDTGKITDIFMDTNFNDLVRTEYTAGLEDRLDEVANGTKNWQEVIGNFYEGFHPKVKEFSAMKREVPKEKSKYTRNLGKDPEGNDIIARMGPYGAIVQMGSKELGNVKYAMIEGGKNIETITIGEAIELLKYPRNFGMYNGMELVLKKGKYGPYLEYNKKTYSLKNAGVSLDEITREKSIEIITTSDGYVPKK
jgi:DNA topoisomerase-1